MIKTNIILYYALYFALLALFVTDRQTQLSHKMSIICESFVFQWVFFFFLVIAYGIVFAGVGIWNGFNCKVKEMCNYLVITSRSVEGLLKTGYGIRSKE